MLQRKTMHEILNKVSEKQKGQQCA